MSKTLHDHIETIESGYEYLLAYAAQGRDTDAGPDGSEVRTTLAGMGDAAAEVREAMDKTEHNFASVVRDDATKAGAAIALVLEQPGISSELVDNLNASIHLRALLTDLFLLSETTS